MKNKAVEGFKKINVKIKNNWRIFCNNKSFFISIMLCFAALIFIVIFINFKMTPNFDYSGNATNVESKLSAQSVPTAINGIIASTSVIIAFGATVIALMYRNIASKSELGGAVIFVTLLLFITSTIYEYYAFFAYSIGGKGFLEFAFKNALIGFIASVFMLFLVFIMIVEIMNRIEKKQKTNV